MTSRRLGDISGRVREARKTSGGPRFLTFEGHLREFSSSVALAPLRLVVMSRDAWDPDVDASVPLIGEFKYPLEKPLGPVMCTSRRVSTGIPGVTKQIMRAAPGTDDPADPPGDDATCFVHYDAWQRNETDAEVWSTRQESEPHQVILGDATRTHEAHEAAVVATSGGNVLPKCPRKALRRKTRRRPVRKTLSVRPPPCLRLWIRDGNTTSRWTRVYSRCV